jgi:hypothetical protein
LKKQVSTLTKDFKSLTEESNVSKEKLSETEIQLGASLSKIEAHEINQSQSSTMIETFTSTVESQV